MRIAALIFIGLLFFSCKKKEETKPNEPGTGGVVIQPSIAVNAHIITYKYYSYYKLGTDTLYSKAYSVSGRMFKTAIDVKTVFGFDEYDGNIKCNNDSLTYFDGSGYTSFGSAIYWPFNWGFTNSSSFGTNNILINDSCSNLTKQQVFSIPDTISISQDFTITLNSSINAFSTAHLVYQNATNSSIANAKVIYSGSTNLTIPASELMSYGPDSMYISLSLNSDNYKVINGKSALFENIGVFYKYIKFKP